jgi:hypothetical protein
VFAGSDWAEIDRVEIDRLIVDFRRTTLDITVEDDIQNFPGVTIDRKADGSILQTQRHLIDSNVKDVRLDGRKLRRRAKSTDMLRRWAGLEELDGLFDFRLLIGELNSLEKETRDKGLIFWAEGGPGLELFVDADFVDN